MSKDKDDILKKIAERCKQLRKERNFTSGETFAYAKGLNRSQYGKYEAGSIDMQITSLEKVIKAYGISVKEFFSEGFD